MTDYDREKIVSLNRFQIGKPEDDRGPVVQCPAQGLANDVCDELNCSRDCGFLRRLSA